MTTEQAKTKCAHSACNCEIDVGQTYCSPYCANQATEPSEKKETHCGCGHVQCMGSDRSESSDI